MKNKTPQVGLSLMLEPEFLRAAYPLFQKELVEVLEWSFDIAWGAAPIPSWADILLLQYSTNNRLLGHGVSLSLLTVESNEYHEKWFERLTEECARYHYKHISEHFGFMVAGEFHRGAPLPVFRDETLLKLAQERMARLKGIAQVAIGLENLAFSFCKEDVESQAQFLQDIIKPVDGFILLDLHNLYCQAKNFGMSMESLLTSYNLDLVREVHVSGGSWSESTLDPDSGPIRRDTHDAHIPEEIFDFLPTVLKQCQNIDAVIFERLGHTLGSDEECSGFHKDYERLISIVKTPSHDK